MFGVFNQKSKARKFSEAVQEYDAELKEVALKAAQSKWRIMYGSAREMDRKEMDRQTQETASEIIEVFRKQGAEPFINYVTSN